MSSPGAMTIVEDAAAEDDRSPARPWQAGALLAALTLVACLPAVRAGFVWEDDRTLTHNPHLQNPAGPLAIWLEPGAAPRFQPITLSVLWIESRLWGAHPGGYHLVSLLLHLGNALLLWTLLRRLQIIGAWLIAALFALHPVQADAVAWISQRSTLLSALFYLAGLLGYLRWCCVTPEEQEFREQLPLLRIGLPQRPRIRYAATLLIIAGAMLSDPVTVTWPLVVLLILRWKCTAIARSDLRPLVPFMAMALTVLAWTIWMELNGLHRAGEVLASVAAHALAACTRLWINIGMLLLPPVTMLRPTYTLPGLPAVVNLIVLAVTASIAGAAWHWRSRLNASVVIAMLLYMVAWLPSALLDALPAGAGNRPLHNLQYLACIAPLALIVFGIHRLCAVRRTLRATTAVMPLLFGAMMFQLTRVYESEELFWRRRIADRGTQRFVHHRLAEVAVREARVDDAATHYRALVSLSPDDVEASLGLARALERLSQRAAAAAEYARSLDLAASDPRVLAAAASFEARRGDAARARELYDAALRLRPRDAEIHNDLALLLDGMELADEAIAHCRAAIKSDPSFVPARLNLATLLFRRGDLNAAAEQLQQVVRISPRNFEAYANGGAMLAQMKQYAQAERMFRNALLIRGDSSEVWTNLALTLQAQGRTGEAEWSLTQAKRYARKTAPDGPR